jgi:hypothetical protein
MHARTAAALAFVSTRDDVHHVAVDSALEIVGRDGTGVALALTGGAPEIVATAGELLPWELGGFGHRASVPLVVEGEPHGDLWIHTTEKLGRRAREDLGTLSAQVEDALGRVGVARPEADDLLASAV